MLQSESVERFIEDPAFLSLKDLAPPPSPPPTLPSSTGDTDGREGREGRGERA
jgi:hypothetical protein